MDLGIPNQLYSFKRSKEVCSFVDDVLAYQGETYNQASHVGNSKVLVQLTFAWVTIGSMALCAYLELFQPIAFDCIALSNPIFPKQPGRAFNQNNLKLCLIRNQQAKKNRYLPFTMRHMAITSSRTPKSSACQTHYP